MLASDRAATKRAAKAKILSKPETDSTSESDSSSEESVTEDAFGGLAIAGESGADFGMGSEPGEASLRSPPASVPSVLEATAIFAAPAFRGTLAGAIGVDAGLSGVEAGLSGVDAGLSGDDLGAFAEPETGAATIGIVAGETVAEIFGVPAVGPALRGTVCNPELAPAPTG